MSPLNRLERRLAKDLELDPDILIPVETIEPVVVPPWWEPLPMDIADSREEAIWRYALLSSTTLPAYTNSSGHSGGIGATVVIRNKNHIRPVGCDIIYMVYAAKLTGIELALTLAEGELEYSIYRKAVPLATITISTVFLLMWWRIRYIFSKKLVYY
ncbi:uncharacterized protein BP01DRAFT_400126 [Aspergillus saccharolyticus JOP 1030-1]|uniref:Uncharacterized protein n=1 Tax=Aspergillus saccharolyticus JOP 1030-1 TaxID=1450539 RepID=A0A318ZJR6_9EURO|nr:hypothetical protein BP01DRAFT_400126 [Aspergillus saccharolyticus JOP 1030-1]PYH44803.1 hypothetical protein BP01DRAFT_400126 [Aspergillus saccharolyticus JOP 1030-1]